MFSKKKSNKANLSSEKTNIALLRTAKASQTCCNCWTNLSLSSSSKCRLVIMKAHSLIQGLTRMTSCKMTRFMRRASHSLCLHALINSWKSAKTHRPCTRVCQSAGAPKRISWMTKQAATRQEHWYPSSRCKGAQMGRRSAEIYQEDWRVAMELASIQLPKSSGRRT